LLKYRAAPFRPSLTNPDALLYCAPGAADIRGETGAMDDPLVRAQHYLVDKICRLNPFWDQRVGCYELRIMVVRGCLDARHLSVVLRSMHILPLEIGEPV
jgi:hypothetical protein